MITSIILGAVVVAVVLFGVYTVYVFVRLAVVSRGRTRGARDRLRHPDVDGIDVLTGFSPPPELVDFYRHSPLVERNEFYLVDHTQNPSAVWFVSGFRPLTALDVSEGLKVAGRLPGIPIADDLGKGTYFVDTSGAVMLDSPNVKGRTVQVSPNIATLAGFEVRDTPPDDERT